MGNNNCCGTDTNNKKEQLFLEQSNMQKPTRKDSIVCRLVELQCFIESPLQNSINIRLPSATDWDLNLNFILNEIPNKFKFLSNMSDSKWFIVIHNTTINKQNPQQFCELLSNQTSPTVIQIIEATVSTPKIKLQKSLQWISTTKLLADTGIDSSDSDAKEDVLFTIKEKKEDDNNSSSNMVNVKEDMDELRSDEKPLGFGKFGFVYKGTYNNETIAVKQYKHTKDYLYEIKIIKHISNSSVENKYANILKPIGISKDLFISEFMSTGSGDKLLYHNSDINIRNKLSILDILDILIDVCHGMKCLHAMGIIHRDLSARNLLFSPNSTKSDNMKKFIVKICDFGECEINCSKSESRKGPYLWLSPESIRKQICNVKTDIYSFGIVCYELIIGARPLPNTRVEIAIIEILCLSKRPNITAYYKLIPLPLFILIQMCWQQIPEFRPNNFSHIVHKLNELKLYTATTTINTKLDEIKFNKTKTKETLKDLPNLISDYLSNDNTSLMTKNKQENEFKNKTKQELLKKIFKYKFNQNTDIKAINWYLDNFPWGEQKNAEQHIEASTNVDQYMKQFDFNLNFVNQIDFP